ncbi:Glycoside hydrolase family 64 protein [Pleurostoma richardsiae]|uniref:Glycoside hydrolase family 64 protein n=1 Tax=Pleurostoma richardsiae TaxID=41990 RepID=A0AA38VJ75_9PEZI|nr:Glycoside hydrolase family 64 protein [Pleurostoma richardsiae]
MPDSLAVQLQNQTDSSEVCAYITGISLQNNGVRVLLKGDGKGLYFPEEPPCIGSPLAEDCAIPLGPPGNTTTVVVPQMAGGRIWFSRGKLTFLLNPGPALVEPSVLNPGDPNADVDFAFAEFTLNNDQLFANISYVDFVPRLPIALTLQTVGGAVQHVSGMKADGLDRVCEGLRSQARKDGRPWDKLIVQREGQPPLRALSPTHGNAVSAAFEGYFEPMVEEVWRKYHPHRGGCQLKINTQASQGVVQGSVNDKDELVIAGEAFLRPTSADVLGCNSGPFVTGSSQTRNAIIPRLAAAFQRSTLLDVEEHPSEPSTFYKREPTNHYSRIVHQACVDGKGYAFAYDDVQPEGGADQSGKVNAGDPERFVVAVGGSNACAGACIPLSGVGVGPASGL